jgi:hypothetical protein
MGNREWNHGWTQMDTDDLCCFVALREIFNTEAQRRGDAEYS